MIVYECERCGRELTRCYGACAPRTFKMKPCVCHDGFMDGVRMVIKYKDAEIKRLMELVVDLEDKLMREQTDGW